MKNVIFVLMPFIALMACGQKMASTFQHAIDQGISLKKLDETYQSALHEDSAKAAFKGREKEFYAGYVALLKELDQFLKQHHFQWGKTTKCFNRIYLNKNGEIDYFFFNFKPGEIEKSKEQDFEKLLGEFIKSYKFPLTNQHNFSQCSPVIYSDQ